MPDDLRTILVTGGAGHIGSTLTKVLLDDGRTRVVVADSLLTGDRANLPAEHGRLTFAECDVNDRDALTTLFAEHRFDFVFHLAAVVGVRRTLDHPMWVLRDVHGLEHVLTLSRDHGVKRVFYASSSEVYGEPVQVPQHETTTPLNSRLPYAIVKNLGEAFFRSFHGAQGLDYTIFRFFNTYGPAQSDDFVLPRFVRRALRGEDLEVYGDGTQTRTFLYVDDAVEACLACLNEDRFVNDVLNVGSDVEITMRGLAERVIAVTGSSSRIVHTPPLPEGDMTRRCPDLTKLRTIKPAFVSLDEGIGRVAARMTDS